MYLHSGSYTKLLLCCFGLAICSLWMVADASAQRPPKGGDDEKSVVPRRPDRKALGPTNVNVLPKFRENRPFARGGSEEYRTFNGTFNNLDRPREGSIFTQLRRESPAAYGPFNSLARSDEASVRMISNVVCGQVANTPNDRGLSDFAWQWGQFMDHDLDLTEFQADPKEYANIQVPVGDPIFDSLSQGGREIEFLRSLHRVLPYRTRGVRQQLNEITAWIDASNVYGSDFERSFSLRTLIDGKLKTSNGGLYPPTFTPLDQNKMFLCGDIRASEQVCLSTMHTLFLREHNRLAEIIKADDPGLSDEEIYQRARKEVYGILESITYNEWLPALLGPDNPLTPYDGYKPEVSPNIANEFSAAAFRFGHTMLSNQLLRLNNDGTPIEDGGVLLRDAFFDADVLIDYGIEPYLKGLMSQQCQEIDTKFISGVRNFLFANVPDADPGPSGPLGFDLAALNFQRGRDHGIPDFNTLRIAYGLAPIASFDELTSDLLVRAQLKAVYADINNLDPLLGCLAEDHASNSSLGPTLIAVLKDQFERCRDADRFWYENVFTGEDLDRIRNTTLADVIKRNSTLTNVQDNVFFVE